MTEIICAYACCLCVAPKKVKQILRVNFPVDSDVNVSDPVVQKAILEQVSPEVCVEKVHVLDVSVSSVMLCDERHF